MKGTHRATSRRHGDHRVAAAGGHLVVLPRRWPLFAVPLLATVMALPQPHPPQRPDSTGSRAIAASTGDPTAQDATGPVLTAQDAITGLDSIMGTGSMAESGQPTTAQSGDLAGPDTPATATQPAQPNSLAATVTVIASGDILLHSELWAQAASDARAAGQPGYDFHQLFASVRDVVSAADLAICHLETPIGEPAGPFTAYPVFTVPPQIVPAIADTGYDSCSTASNHSLDGGAPGIRRTLSALDAAGLAHAGTARSIGEHNTPTIINIHGVRVAHLSYTFSFNGIARPAGEQWLANDLTAAAVLGEARRARAAGAEIVIVSAHWGTEYSQAASPGQITLARRLLASPDIDLVLGHHAHVVQPFERIGDKWVVYGMGNEVASQPQRATNRDGVPEALPTMMDLGGTGRLVLVPTALGNRDTTAALREACLASLARTTVALTARGAVPAGLVIRDRLP